MKKQDTLGPGFPLTSTVCILLKVSTAEKFQKNKIEADSIEYREANKKAKISSAFIPLVRIMILLGFLFTLTLGGHKTIIGELPVGSYSVLIFLTQRFLWPFTRLGIILDDFSRAKASSLRIFNLLDTPINIETSQSNLTVNSDQKPDIIFNKVTFL